MAKVKTNLETKKELYQKIWRVADELKKQYDVMPSSAFVTIQGRKCKIEFPYLEYTGEQFIRTPLQNIPLGKMPIRALRRMLKNNQERLKDIRKYYETIICKFPSEYAAIIFDDDMPHEPINIISEIANGKVKELVSMAFLSPTLNKELDFTTSRYINIEFLKLKGQERRINICANLGFTIKTTVKLYIPSPFLFLYHLDEIKEKFGIKGDKT